jgi:hypothetical protein
MPGAILRLSVRAPVSGPPRVPFRRELAGSATDRLPVVILAADECERLRRLDRQALSITELSEADMAAIAAARIPEDQRYRRETCADGAVAPGRGPRRVRRVFAGSEPNRGLEEGLKVRPWRWCRRRGRRKARPA